ncbi:hypothetical protein [Chryseobacterium sp. 22543]|uniref:hypothetical protein n=1 Tax=Chryseobacterium sp. 22543 TaxID=3453940 RepID=UPI003F83204F
MMKIKYGYQLSIDDLKDLEIDLFLFANNNESRKYSLYNKIKSNNLILKTISLYYQNEFKEISGIENKYIRNHYEIEDLLDDYIMNCEKDSLKIVVDYSCMTKSWYYIIMLYLSNKEFSLKKVTCIFSYTPSKFSEPLRPKANSDISPLPGKITIPNNRPKALIVGIGYEENKAQGIIDQIDPAKVFLMYSKPTLDEKFTNSIEINNENVLKYYSDTTETYNFSDLVDIENKLKTIYYKFCGEYNIIISPIGPKPFTFVSMILSIMFPDIEIWRIGSGEDINPYPREPFDDDTFIISEVYYEK